MKHLTKRFFSINFLKKISSLDIFEKKFISKNLYNKFFICNSVSVINEPIIYTVDDSFNIFHIKHATCKKFIKKKTKLFSGYSLQGNSRVFASKFNPNIRFSSFIVNPENRIKNDIVENFKDALQILYTIPPKGNKNLKGSFLVKAIKGGFRVYCFGILGFLPRSHFLYAQRKRCFALKKRLKIFSKFLYLKKIKKLLKKKLPIPLKRRLLRKALINYKKKIVKKKRALLNHFNFLLGNKNVLKKTFLLRIPLFIGGLKVIPGFRKRNYSKSPKRKRKVISSLLNFVFLSHVKKKKKWRKKKNVAGKKSTKRSNNKKKNVRI